MVLNIATYDFRELEEKLVELSIATKGDPLFSGLGIIVFDPENGPPPYDPMYKMMSETTRFPIDENFVLKARELSSYHNMLHDGFWFYDPSIMEICSVAICLGLDINIVKELGESGLINNHGVRFRTAMTNHYLYPDRVLRAYLVSGETGRVTCIEDHNSRIIYDPEK